MKIGDVVMSTKVRPYENAKVVKSNVTIKFNKKTGKKETRTEYVAEYKDGSTFIFYGFNINKSVFKVMEADGQMRLEDYYHFDDVED